VDASGGVHWTGSVAAQRSASTAGGNVRAVLADVYVQVLVHQRELQACRLPR
jgi:hypothetical protein